MSTPPSDLVQSLRRGLRVLEEVAASDRPVGVRELSERVGLHLSTTYHLVNTLVHDGYLERGADRGVVLGRRRVAGAGSLPERTLAPVRRALGRAAYAVNDAALLVRLDDGAAVTALAEAVPGAPSASVHAARTAHRTAGGRTLLAHHPVRELPALLTRVRARAAAAGEPFDESALTAELASVRARRFALALDDEPAQVAAPVPRPHGGEATAVVLAVTPERLRERGEAFTWVARRTASAIGRLLPPGAVTGAAATDGAGA